MSIINMLVHKSIQYRIDCQLTKVPGHGIVCHSPYSSECAVLISLPQALSSYVDKSLKSVMHGQCYARPMVTFPATDHYCSITGTKLYSLMTEAHVYKQ